MIIEQPLFTIPLFYEDINNAEHHKKDFMTALISYERTMSNDNIRHVKTWQTPNDLHINPVFEPVIEGISDIMHEVKDRYKLSDTETTGIDSMCGLSINTDGKMLSTYQTGGFMHGVYFVEVPKEIKLSFNNIIPDRSYFPNIFSYESNDVNSDYYSVDAKEGQMLICPSFVSIESNINFASKSLRYLYFTVRTQVL